MLIPSDTFLLDYYHVLYKRLALIWGVKKVKAGYLSCDQHLLFYGVFSSNGVKTCWIVSAHFSCDHKLRGRGRKQGIFSSVKVFRFQDHRVYSVI